MGFENKPLGPFNYVYTISVNQPLISSYSYRLDLHSSLLDSIEQMVDEMSTFPEAINVINSIKGKQ